MEALNIVYFPAPMSFPPALDTPRMRDLWAQWTEERRGHKKPKCGWDAFFARQLNWLAEYGEPTAYQTVRASLNNGWVGLFPDRFAHVCTTVREAVPVWAKIRNLESLIAAKEKAMPGLANRWVDGEEAYQRDMAAREACKAEIAALKRQLNQLKEQQI